MTNPQHTVKQLRVFGLVFGLFVCVVNFLILYRLLGYDLPWLYWFGAMFATVGVLLPSLLEVPLKIWLKFGDVLHRINSTIILFVLFSCIVTPIGFLLFLFGKKPIKSNDNASTFFKTSEVRHPKDLNLPY